MAVVLTKERSITINPCKMCQPIGAIWGVAGVKGAIPLVHGSQGCATFPRYQFAKHFREPVDVAVTSLSEGTAVFGGKPNLLQALENLIRRYQPEAVGVITTCLSETIGDDVPSIIREFRRTHPEYAGVQIFPINTPSYVGNHENGYDTALKVMVDVLTAGQVPDEVEPAPYRINLIPGMLNPADTAELV
ncbi:MAG TPA: hypothetical protein GXX28_12595, partial [Firmicutes bacterium]|nr:hypothetical protein [Bacillota bacterium]